MKVCIHRGANEIGGSCIELEASGQTLLVDAGLSLADDPETASWCPDLGKREPLATVVSHGHLDHCGLLPRLPRVPVVMGAAARRILRAALPYMGQRDWVLDGPELADGQVIGIGPFRITPYLVDHSAYDAYALLIEANGKRLFYSGDLRAHGRKRGVVERLMASPPENIDVLLLEGTTLGRSGDLAGPETEQGLEARFVQAFRQTRGLVLVQVSPQNIDRMVTIYRACLLSGRTLLIDLYTAMILEATGNPSIPQSDWERVALCIPKAQRIQIKRNAWFADLRRHSRNRIYLERQMATSPGLYVQLFRGVWMKDMEKAGVLDGGALIHSQWEGYQREPRFREIEAWRERHGLESFQIHTSGHASPSDLKRFAEKLTPKVLVPIHTAVPEDYGSIYPHVVRHDDGEWWEV